VNFLYHQLPSPRLPGSLLPGFARFAPSWRQQRATSAGGTGSSLPPPTQQIMPGEYKSLCREILYVKARCSKVILCWDLGNSLCRRTSQNPKTEKIFLFLNCESSNWRCFILCIYRVEPKKALGGAWMARTREAGAVEPGWRAAEALYPINTQDKAPTPRQTRDKKLKSFDNTTSFTRTRVPRWLRFQIVFSFVDDN